MRMDGHYETNSRFSQFSKAPNPALMTIAPDVLWLLALCIRVCDAWSDRRLLLFSV